MSKTMLRCLRHRITVGRWLQREDDTGQIMRTFKSFSVIWADIKPVLLTSCLPIDVSNNSHGKQIKALYKVTIRANSLTEKQQREVNAVLWKNKILNNFYGFNPDVVTDYACGHFSDGGQEMKND